MAASIKDSPKKDNLIFTGVLEDVKPYIRACDALVFAGTTPHSGRPVYEAWAFKKPVITFDSIVMRMDVADGRDGCIVKKHSGKALASAILHLMENPSKARKMGINGHEKAKELFSLTRNSEKILDIYSEIFKS